MTLQQVLMLAIQASILLTVFGFGLQATVRDLTSLVRRPGLLARSLLAMFVIMPIVAVLLVRVIELRTSFAVALVALAISPIPPLLPGKESKAGGDSAYGLGLMSVVAVLAVGIVPLLVEIMERYFGRPLEVPASTIARVMLTSTVLPLFGGVMVRAIAPAIATRLAKPVNLFATVLLLVCAAVLLVAALPVLRELIDVRTIFALAAFVAIGLVAGHALGGPQPDEATVLALSTASRHPAMALAIAKVNFPDEPYLGVTVLLYLLVAAVISVPYVLRQRRLLVPRVS